MYSLERPSSLLLTGIIAKSLPAIKYRKAQLPSPATQRQVTPVLFFYYIYFLKAFFILSITSMIQSNCAFH